MTVVGAGADTNHKREDDAAMMMIGQKMMKDELSGTDDEAATLPSHSHRGGRYNRGCM